LGGKPRTKQGEPFGDENMLKHIKDQMDKGKYNLNPQQKEAVQKLIRAYSTKNKEMIDRALDEAIDSIPYTDVAGQNLAYMKQWRKN
jgi:hypothetical protein